MCFGTLAMREHRRTAHPPAFHCPVCNVAIKRRDNLYGATGHLRKKHPDVADRFCTPSTFNTSSVASNVADDTIEGEGETSEMEVEPKGDSRLGSATPLKLRHPFRRTYPLRKFDVEVLSMHLDKTLEGVPFPVRVSFDFGLVARDLTSGRITYRPARKCEAFLSPPFLLKSGDDVDAVAGKFEQAREWAKEGLVKDLALKHPTNFTF